MDRYEKLKLIDGLTSKTLRAGEWVFMEGDDGDNFYMLEEGEVECLKYTDDSTNQDSGEDFVHVRDLHMGDHFGELALL